METAKEKPATTPPENKPQSKKPEGKPEEFGGPAGPEPTRFGDWEIGGRCSDF